MTTLAERRTELAAALVAVGIRVDDVAGAAAVPYAVIYGGGITAAESPGGQLRATFRIMLVAGRADAAATVAELGELAMRTLTALWSLKRWQVGPVGADTVRRLPGEYLTNDATASVLFLPDATP